MIIFAPCSHVMGVCEQFWSAQVLTAAPRVSSSRFALSVAVSSRRLAPSREPAMSALTASRANATCPAASLRLQPADCLSVRSPIPFVARQQLTWASRDIGSQRHAAAARAARRQGVQCAQQRQQQQQQGPVSADQVSSKGVLARQHQRAAPEALCSPMVNADGAILMACTKPASSGSLNEGWAEVGIHRLSSETVPRQGQLPSA